MTDRSASARAFPAGATTDIENCIICHVDDAEARAVVFRDDLWACEVLPGYEVPGWFVLRARRHALGWQELDPAELETFGQRAQQLICAVSGVFAVPATYLVSFGESYPHFHCLIAARGDDVPEEYRLGAILSLRQQRLDRERALAWVPAVRDAYGQLQRP